MAIVGSLSRLFHICRLCQVLNLDPRPVLIAEVLFSNIGGTGTGGCGNCTHFFPYHMFAYIDAVVCVGVCVCV